MLSILSDSQKAVVETITMKMHVGPALQYLKDVGHAMSERTYFRKKKKLEDMKLERLEFIARHFEDQHLHRLDKLELIENLMWENCHAEKNPSKRVKILESITNTQPYLSSYYEVTKTVYDHCLPKGEEQHHESVPWANNDNDSKELEAWTVDRDPQLPKAVVCGVRIPSHTETIPEPITEIIEAEAKPITETIPTQEPEPKQSIVQEPEQEQEPEQKNPKDIVVDIDVLGRFPKPFDIEPWIQCKLDDCNKWFKTKEIRNKHIAKYHH